MISIKKKRNRVYDDLIFSMYSFVACATNLFNIISIKIKEIEKKISRIIGKSDFGYTDKISVFTAKNTRNIEVLKLMR